MDIQEQSLVRLGLGEVTSNRLSDLCFLFVCSMYVFVCRCVLMCVGAHSLEAIYFIFEAGSLTKS